MFKFRLIFFSLFFIAVIFFSQFIADTAFSQERQMRSSQQNKKPNEVIQPIVIAPSEFQANFEISSDKAIEAGTILALELDKKILSELQREDMSDLAVFNAQGELVPFGVFEPKASDETLNKEYKLKIFPVYSSYDSHKNADLSLLYELKSDGQLVPRVNLGEPETQQALSGYIMVMPADRVALKKLKFFWQGDQTGKVKIEASADLQSWTTLKRDFVLARLSQGDDVLELNELNLDYWLNSRYLRVTFEDKPFPIDEVMATISAVYSKEPEVKTVSVSPTFFVGPLEKDAVKEEDNALIFDLGGVFPDSSFNVNLPSYGFLKGIKVYRRSNENDPWRYVMRSNFYTMKNNGIILKNQPYYTRYKGTFYDPSNLQGSARYWKLVPNLESENLPNNAEVEIEYLPQKIYFLAQGTAPYTLSVGNKALSVDQTINSLVKNLDPTNFPLVSLGQKLNVPNVIKPVVDSSTKEESPIWYTYALWAVLFIVVAGMSYMAFSLMKKINVPNAVQADEDATLDENGEKIDLEQSHLEDDEKNTK